MSENIGEKHLERIITLEVELLHVKVTTEKLSETALDLVKWQQRLIGKIAVATTTAAALASVLSAILVAYLTGGI